MKFNPTTVSSRTARKPLEAKRCRQKPHAEKWVVGKQEFDSTTSLVESFKPGTKEAEAVYLMPGYSEPDAIHTPVLTALLGTTFATAAAAVLAVAATGLAGLALPGAIAGLGIGLAINGREMLSDHTPKLEGTIAKGDDGKLLFQANGTKRPIDLAQYSEAKASDSPSKDQWWRTELLVQDFADEGYAYTRPGVESF